MTILPQLRQTARAVRRVSVSSSQTIVVLDGSWPSFPCSLTEPARDPGSDDASPRELPAATLQHALGWREPTGDRLRVGDRVEIDGEVWELLADPRDLRAGSRPSGVTAPVQRLTVLYPYAGSLQAQGGSPELVAALPLAIWSPSEAQEDRGTYEDSDAEAPIEFLQTLQENNRWIQVGSRRYRVTSAEADLKAARTSLRLRWNRG